MNDAKTIQINTKPFDLRRLLESHPSLNLILPLAGEQGGDEPADSSVIIYRVLPSPIFFDAMNNENDQVLAGILFAV
jgi:hypothetical protein